MRAKKIFIWVAAFQLLLLGVFLAFGINQAEGQEAMSITPNTAKVETGDSVNFTAAGGGGSGVYQWSVDPAGLGTIDASGSATANQAVFKAGPKSGNGRVIVTDSEGNFAVANVAVDASVLIVPSTFTVKVNETQNLTASGGAGGYQWSVDPSGLGTIDASGSATANQAIFTGASAGNGKIIVRDSKGNLAESGVVVAASSEDGPPPAATTTCPEGTGQIPKEGGGCGCPPGQSPDASGNCQLINPAPGQLASIGTFPELLGNIIRILLTFGGIIAVIFLILGGYQYIAARGNEEATETAKKTITGAVIGVIVIVLSFAIVAIVNNLIIKGP